MFPRKSSIQRSLFCALSIGLFFVWWNVPAQEISRNEPDRDVVWWANETQPHLNLLRVQHEWNVLQSAANMTTVNELHHLNQTEFPWTYSHSSANLSAHKRQHSNNEKDLLPINPHPFNYILNPGKRICSGKDIFMLIYIHSAPSHLKQRMVIRETWGKQSNYPGNIIKLIFLCGISSEKTVQDALLMESNVYKDIIQEDFVDSYRNLTYKAIMGLKWISTYCMHAKFLLKSDDDIFVNMYKLIAYLKTMVKDRGIIKKLLLCHVFYKQPVMRHPKSKWYVSPIEYKRNRFPTYCSGSAFVLTTDVAATMFKASFDTNFFWVDDLYVTGFLAKKINITHVHFGPVYVFRVFYQRFVIEKDWLKLVVAHVHNLDYLKIVWRNVLEEYIKNGFLRLLFE